MLKAKCLDNIKWKSHGQCLLQWYDAIEAELSATDARLTEVHQDIVRLHARLDELGKVKQEALSVATRAQPKRGAKARAASAIQISKETSLSFEDDTF